MVQQGRLLAAALGGGLELDPAAARALIARLDRRTEARLRVVDRAGRVVADSSRPSPAAAPAPDDSESGREYRVPERRDNLLYRLGAALYRLAEWALGDSSELSSTPRSVPGTPLGPEVRAALAGRYGAATRASGPGQRSLTLAIAIPVRSADGSVAGAVAVSQSTLRILGALIEVRLGVFRVFLASVAAAAVLTLLFATTIARPLRRLRDEALALVDRRGRLRGSFRGSRRADEIGDLARALEQLTRRLDGHLRFIEGFAADVSHELKNPLAAIAGAAELLAEVEDPADRARFHALVRREAARMERLLAAVRDVSRIDAGLETEPAEDVDLATLLPEVLESFRLQMTRAGVAGAAGRRIEAVLAVADGGPLVVRAAPERLTQLFENLLDNAGSFSPDGGTVALALARAADGDRDWAVIRVDDQGPGIPPAHLERVFDRFFTWRPGEPRDGHHAGLGLAICRALAEGYGGAITAANRPEGGARFEVRLPLAA